MSTLMIDGKNYPLLYLLWRKVEGTASRLGACASYNVGLLDPLLKKHSETCR